MKKKLVTGILSVVLCVGVLAGFTRLTEPKYDGKSSPLEGNFTAEYYDEKTAHDVLFVGDCEVYENFDPIYLWEHFGITSYIRGNAQQQVWQSYYMLKDTLRYETPEVVIYNVQELIYNEPQREEYNRMTFDGMRWSKVKWDGIRASMMPGEHMIEYIFPLLRYHSRITALDAADVRYFFNRRRSALNGYYMRIDVLPVSGSDVASTDWVMTDYPGQLAQGQVTNPDAAGGSEEIYDPWEEKTEESGEIDDPWEEKTEESEEIDDPWEEKTEESEEIDDPWGEITEESGEIDDPQEEAAEEAVERAVESKHRLRSNAMNYLDLIRQLCEEQGIRLILIKAPSLAPRWYPVQETQVREYAKQHQLPYINFYEKIAQLGINYETDTYDGGLHMNYSGAKKLSEYIGGELVERYGVAGHRGEEELEQEYGKKQQLQQEMIRAQEQELEEYGRVVSY